jgi:glucosylceramidase
MGRVPIASSDFALADKTYDDTPNDFNLINFSLLHEDFAYKIPIIQQALNLTKNNLKLFASPWSAPGWMKDNGKMTNGGSLNGNASDPNDQNHKTWANYFVK